MNKKILFFLFLLLFSIYTIYSIPRPRKNKEVGAIVGQISLQGYYSGWQLTIYFKDNKTGRDYILKPRGNRYYHLLNLIPGTYTLYKFGISSSSSERYMWASGLELKDQSINIIVKENMIIPVNYLEIYIEDAGINRIQYGFRKDNIDFNEYLNNLKLYFEEKDKRGFWEDFEWMELKS